MAHCGEELVLELAGALRFFLGLEQGFLGALLQGDIVKYDHTTLEGAIPTPQRPAGNTKQTTLRDVRVTNEELHGVHTLAAHRANQR